FDCGRVRLDGLLAIQRVEYGVSVIRFGYPNEFASMKQYVIRYVALAMLQLIICVKANAEVTITHESSTTCSSPCSSIAVIFVHGLTGSRDTWVNTTTGQSFPKLLAEDPNIRDKIDVYSVEYSSLWNSGAPIVAVTKDIAVQLDPIIKEKRYPK